MLSSVQGMMETNQGLERGGGLSSVNSYLGL